MGQHPHQPCERVAQLPARGHRPDIKILVREVVEIQLHHSAIFPSAFSLLVLTSNS